ncbi:hypothetical protein HNR12_004548 [Streptomonospora nanhaiensis]|uniref:Uncharacterized protein n=1 Tax=Streptomonospora nanhaiensis TaxID=1323731 RepID=A0A853BUU6_9ACTN|nr:hypothetical protein [Streptomonospora nanhaiensis]
MGFEIRKDRGPQGRKKLERERGAFAFAIARNGS